MRKGTRGLAAKEALELGKKFRQAVKDGNEALIASLMAQLAPPTKQLITRIEKAVKTCRLTSCTRTHTHNNSYCSAEHCIQDREAA